MAKYEYSGPKVPPLSDKSAWQVIPVRLLCVECGAPVEHHRSGHGGSTIEAAWQDARGL